MDVDSEINNFEQVLMGYSAGKSLLYKDKNCKETSDGLKSIDIINNVAKQIKVINKNVFDNKLKTFKKSNLAPVNLLTLDPQQKPGTSNKFETQFELDTQLLTVIKDAEAIKDTRTDVTQEFDITFEQIVESKLTQDKFANINCEKSKCLKIQSSTTPSSCNLKRNFSLESKCNEETGINNHLNDDQNIPTNYFDDGLDELETCTVQIFNTQEYGKPLLSPILHSKKFKKSQQHSSITCTLETFEKFEAIAGPIVQEHSNQEIVKGIINSRIFDKTFILLDQDHTHDLKNTKLKLMQFKSEKSANPDESDEDILFSSDEESDYLPNQIKDLPLTCALETSFYKQEDVLDKTMFVGFQTASNKSIQVLTDSFSKAKNILNDLNDHGKISSNPLSITELVKEYDCALNHTKNMKNNMSIYEKEGEYKFSYDKNILANEIECGYESSSNMFLNISEEACKTNKMICNDSSENPNKLKVNHSTNIVVTHLKENKKHLNQDIKVVPGVASTSHVSSTQEEINIDECLMQEFEDSLLCLNDNKLHTNSKISHSSSTKGCDSNELINIPKCVLNPICGFTTASKKPIKISDEGITKMKNIFEDIDINLMDTKIVLGQNNFSHKIVNAENKKKGYDYNQYNCKSDRGKTNCHQLSTKDEPYYDKKLMKEIDLTTSNYPVNIPKEGLVETRQDGKSDSCKEKQANNFTVESRFLQGFKTASNKPIVISEKAVVKSSKILQEFDFEYNLIDSDMHNAKCRKQSPKASDSKLFKEYTTGFNNCANVSEETLLKSKLILDSDKILDNNVDKCEDNKINDTIKKFNFIQGFQTASNKPVVISENALAKSKKILQEFDFPVNQKNRDEDDEKCNKQLTENITHYDAKCKGELEYQSNNKGDDMDSAICRKQCTINTHNDNKLVKENTIISNIPVNFLDTSLTESKQMLDFNKSHENNMDDDCKENKVSNFIMETTLFQGFKTASNRPVVISEKALVESNKILQEFHSQNNFFNKNMCEVKTNQQLSSQNTLAFNNNIDIQGRNLANSKRMLDFVDCGNDKGKENKINEESKGFAEEFQVASNKRVKITDVLRTSEIGQNHIPLIDYDNVATSKEYSKDPEMEDLTLPKMVFQGFKTANNNQVKVSEEAMARSKKMFQDINDHSDNLTKIKNTNINVMGFQTANNKVAEVSEEALRKSKKIFEDIDVNLKTGIKQKLKNSPKHGQNVAIKKLINNKNNKLNRSDSKLVPNENTYKDIVRSTKHLTNADDIHNIINTEVIRDFEETLYTEDFSKKSPLAKRAGSPILSCPNAKRIKNNSTTNEESEETEQNISKNVFTTNYKKIKQYKLLDIYEIEKESKQIKSSPGVHFDIDDILKFEFGDTRNEISNKKWSTCDVKKYFLDSVNKKIIPEGWVENHIKHILLKLISYEKRFPNIMTGVCSVSNIMDQLKYRYDRELYNVERPALRKILEKDEVPCRRVVLNVLNIYIDGITITKTSLDLSENIELLLSDGWYCVKTTIDKMLIKLVKEGKIVVGTKLITQGAELLNCEQGIAPWENTSSIRLKIFGNSTRRAHWATRLGFHDSSAPFVSFLTAVKPEGGKISQLRVVVTRVYPMLYVEKFDDGSTVTRSERLENLHQTKYETERESLLEKVYEEVEKEFTNQDSQDHESMDVDAKNLESGSQIYQLMKKSRDPTDFRANLSHSQAKLLQEYTIKQRERSIQELQAKVQEVLKKKHLNVVRNVVPMLKIRVADVYRNSVTKAVITVWRPNETLLHILKEGTWVDIFNVVPTAVRYSEIQISAGKQSVFRKAVKIQDQKRNIVRTFERKCFTIHELMKNPYLTTDYNEVDTVGFVFDIKPSLKDFDSKNDHFQNVFLADVNKKVICINFWGGLRKFGYENILEIGQIVACVNLQKRLGNSRKSIPQYRATEFSYFTKTPKLETSRQLFDDLSKQFSSLDRRKFIQDCNILRSNFDNIKHGNVENISPYRFNNSDYNISKNKVFINSPAGDFNLNWVDFESSFKQSETVLSPKTVLRKKEISEKIARLKKYGEPPPLSSIHIVNKTKEAAKPYKSPLLSKHEPNAANSSNSKVNTAVETKIISNIETSRNATNANASGDLANNQCTSPVLPYRCRTVNPVKLNFSKRDVTKDDPFGEDFESSPPLSLD